MKTWVLSLCLPLIAWAAPSAVVFDFGGVMAHPDREVIVKFLCKTLHITPEEMERANLEKRAFVKNGRSDVDFWLSFAKKKGTTLPSDWPVQYHKALKETIGADPKMYALVDELKKQGVQVGLLSNIEGRYGSVISSYGFYEPFDPALLSYEIGVEKPDPKAFHILLQALERPPNEVIFIDDKLENVQAAKALGIDAIQFKSAHQVRCELERRGYFTRCFSSVNRPRDLGYQTLQSSNINVRS